MKSLQLYSIETVDHIVTPEDFEAITLKSPAINIFTDFKKFKPLIIDSTTKAVDTQLLMAKAHVNLKIVISKDQNFAGVISKEDVSNLQLIKHLCKGESRDDILVSDLMRPRASLVALDYQELENAIVADVIKTLEKNGLQHCLVVDHVNHEIRGLISSRDIARKLQIPINLDLAPSFADIFSVIHTIN